MSVRLKSTNSALRICIALISKILLLEINLHSKRLCTYCRPEDGKSMKKFSLLQILRLTVIVYEWLDIPLLKKYYDFGFDHYNLQWHKAGLRGLIDALLDRRGPFVDANWVLPDLSIQSSVELNRKLKTCDRTYYFRYATSKGYYACIKSTNWLVGKVCPNSKSRLYLFNRKQESRK